MDNTLRVAGILRTSLVNGEGCRDVIFVSGCKHNCEGCHNKDMQDYNYGKDMSIKGLANLVLSDIPLVDGVTYSGGEPFDKIDGLVELSKSIRSVNPKLSIWSYSGYTFEQIINNPEKIKLLSIIDVLVDGKFDINLMGNGDMMYRGSSNQRIIDVKRSLVENKVVLYEL